MKDIFLISTIIEHDSYIILSRSNGSDDYTPFQYNCDSFNIDNTAVEAKIKNELNLDVEVIEDLKKFYMNESTIKYLKCKVLNVSQLSDNNKIILLNKNLRPKVKINKFIKSNLENLGYFFDQEVAIIQKTNRAGNKRFGIIKSEIDIKIKKMNKFGVNTEFKRVPKIIVSLTSFPDRMYDIHYTLYSLMNQTLKPDKIVLWLGEEQFPNKEKDLPSTVLNMKKFGLSIKWCEDIKSFKKLIPSLLEYYNDIIITADDDIYYHKDCIKRLYKSYQKYPKCIHCNRSHQIVFNSDGKLEPLSNWKKQKTGPNISYKNWFYGCNGILYPPNTLNKTIFNKELFFKLCPTADDTWFWAMAILNGTKIMIIENNLSLVLNTNLKRALEETNEFMLNTINNINQNNLIQINNVLNYFNLYDKIK